MNFAVVFGCSGLIPPPYLKLWTGGVLHVSVFGALFGMCILNMNFLEGGGVLVVCLLVWGEKKFLDGNQRFKGFRDSVEERQHLTKTQQQNMKKCAFQVLSHRLKVILM